MKQMCSNVGCPNEAWIRLLDFKMDGTPNPYADRLYCRECWKAGSFDSVPGMPTRWPEGAEL